MRNRVLALVLTLLAVIPRLATATDNGCSDADRRLLLMTKPEPHKAECDNTAEKKSGEHGGFVEVPAGLGACLDALGHDVAAIRERLVSAAKQEAAQDKYAEKLATLVKELQAVVAAPELDTTKLKLIVRELDELLEILVPSSCLEQVRKALVVLRELQDKPKGDDTRTKRLADAIALLQEPCAAKTPRDWVLKIPGADSQLTAKGPSDAPIDEYLLDAKGAVNQMIKWVDAQRKGVGLKDGLKCAAGENTNVASGLLELEHISGGARTAVNKALESYKSDCPSAATEVDAVQALIESRSAIPSGNRTVIRALKAYEAQFSASSNAAVAKDAREALNAIEAGDTVAALVVSETACAVRGQIDALLGERGLRPRLIGVLVPAVNFTRGGDGAGTDSTKATAHVELTSRHGRPFGGNTFRVAWIGRVGYRQIYHLAEPAPGTDGKAPSNSDIANETAPRFDGAFVWDTGAKLAFRIRSAGELGINARVGQSLLGGNPQLQEGKPDKAPATLVVPVDKSGSGVWYREVSARAVLFRDRNGHFVEAYELGVLRPMASIECGVRWDDRLVTPGFSTVSDVAERQTLLATVRDRFGRHPTRRRFLRFELSGVPVAGVDANTFSLTFAVEHEWHGWGSSRIAAGTKVYLQGKLDLVNALKGL